MRDNHLKDKYNNIEIPENIDEFISKGIDKGKRSKKKRNIKIISTVVASMLIIILTVSIRISPVFAEIIEDLPLGEYIVRLINHDKGLDLALENDYIQHINKSDEHENLLFTIDDIIMDEERMFIFYTLENKGNNKYIRPSSVDFYDEKGNEIFLGGGWTILEDKNMSKEENRVISNYLEADTRYLTEDLPENLTIKVKFKEWDEMPTFEKSQETGDVLDSTWEVDLKIDKEKFKYEPKEYDIKEEVEIAGQRIKIIKLIQHPISSEIEILYDGDNTMEIFELLNFRIVDEKGEFGNFISGEQTNLGNNILETRRIESNYFNNPEELYIMLDGIYALDKENLELKVDVDKEKILNPIDDKIEVINIYKEQEDDDIYHIKMGLNISEKQMYHIGIRHDDPILRDESGNPMDSGFLYKEFRNATLEEQKDGYNYIYTVGVQDTTDSEGILTLDIWHYPNIIEKDIKIKVK